MGRGLIHNSKGNSRDKPALNFFYMDGSQLMRAVIKRGVPSLHKIFV